MNLANYQTLVFDCDGVILDSNRIKTEAFYQAALPYGKAAAEALVQYHVSNGGISRYKKFAFFLEHLLTEFPAKEPESNESKYNKAIETLLTRYAAFVAKGLNQCNVAEGLPQLRHQTSHARWLVVSGGDQQELREVFRERGIEHFFDGGIFGSPETKDTILARESATRNIARPALYFGDSHYDYKASRNAGLDFVFLNGWSEWQPDEEWLRREGIQSARFLKDLLDV